MPRRITFENCQLDLGSHTLKRDGVSVPVEPIDYRVLVHLISKAPDYVSSTGLMRQIWPNTIVGDNSLHQAIRRLRKALGDSARHSRFIQTLPKVGYRFIAEIDDGSNAGNGSNGLDPVVVLPFQDYALDEANPYIVDGLLYELCQHLKLAQIEVISSECVGRLRANGVPDQQLCELLGARTIITGAVAQQAGRLRVNASMSNVASNRLLWSQSFDLDDGSLFDAQSTMAKQIANSVADMMDRGALTQCSRRNDKPVSLSLWRAGIQAAQP